eukprot:TRINITY_DN10734_c2_g1_i2.p1 TRINITY_DN10734_c2_g1~~TRINITY_DN10734_c2_g1_i2.p1  ORF type:complete len:331 (+),score=56.03 TRINITY_DN10734_c2_g1_i2:74-1066(+)
MENKADENETTTPIELWLDCDPGHDDMMAIILAAYHPKVKLLGISTTSGNAILDKTTDNALKTLYASGIQNIDVIPGSREAFLRGRIAPAEIFGESGLEGAVVPRGTQKALDVNLFIHLRTLLLNAPHPITLAATGPYTNYAVLLKAFPEVKPKIARIYLLGGAIALGNITEAAEYNCHCDPEAAKVVYESGIPLIIVPADVSQTAKFTPSVRERIISDIGGTAYGKIIVSLLDFYTKEAEAFGNLGGASIHDPCLIAALIAPELFTFKQADVRIETRSEHCDGRTLFNLANPKSNISLAVTLHVDSFWEMMFAALQKANAASPLNHVVS